METGTKISIGVVVFGIPLGAVTFLGWAMFGDHSSYDEHLSWYEGLPATASDIAVYHQRNISGLVIAHFAIRETDFVDWADGNKCEVEEIDMPILVSDPLLRWLDCHYDQVYVADGLYGVHSERPNGGHVQIIYDRFTNRGRLRSTSR